MPLRRSIAPPARGRAPGSQTADAVVLVPLKAFGLAKSRLAGILGSTARAQLVRAMATRVVRATGPAPCVVVCDDTEVADFARDLGAGVAWTPGLDLNDALASAAEDATRSGHGRIVVAAGDLPFAHGLGSLGAMCGRDLSDDVALVVPDRHRDGTNVLTWPASVPMRTAYGPGSFHRHCELARSLGLTVVELHDEALGWDVDHPEDLVPPPHLGQLPSASLPTGVQVHDRVTDGAPGTGVGR